MDFIFVNINRVCYKINEFLLKTKLFYDFLNFVQFYTTLRSIWNRFAEKVVKLWILGCWLLFDAEKQNISAGD